MQQENWTLSSYREVGERLHEQLGKMEETQEHLHEGLSAVRTALDGFQAEEKADIPYPPLFLRFLNAFPPLPPENEITLPASLSLTDTARDLQEGTKTLCGLRGACDAAMRFIQETILQFSMEALGTTLPKEALDAMQHHVVSIVLLHQNIHVALHHPSPKLLLLPATAMYRAVLQSLACIHSDLAICRALRRSAMRSRDAAVLTFASWRVSRVVEDGFLYMETMERAMRNLYRNGETLGTSLVHLDPYFNASPSKSPVELFLQKLPPP